VATAERHEAGGFWSDAVATWAAIAGLDQTAYHFLRYSSALENAGQLKEAEGAARKALELGGPSALACMQLGLVLRKLDRLDEARDALEHSRALEEMQPVLTILGNIYLQLGDADAAEEALRRSLVLSPGDDETLLALGLVLALSDPNLAAECFVQALDSEPDLFEARVQLGRVLLDAKRFEEARRLLQDAIKRKPEEAWSHLMLGDAMVGLGDLAAARDAMAEAVALDDREPYFVGCLARVMEKLGHFKEAERLYKNALRLDVGDAVSNRKYGLFLERSGFPGRAILYLERALQQDPGNAHAKLILERLRKTM
jgi:tetratricopeptide (TPR) repeat protein